MTTTIIVLAMHGAPPNDFPRREKAEFFGLHARLNQATGEERGAVERRHAELDARMRAWPRTAQNDPYHASALELAEQLQHTTGCHVVVGFNEFCGPGLDEALDQSLAHGADRVVVMTPMTTRGGEHAEVEIPKAVREAMERHPGATIDFVWPYDVSEVARFLSAQMRRHLEKLGR